MNAPEPVAAGTAPAVRPSRRWIEWLLLTLGLAALALLIGHGNGDNRLDRLLADTWSAHSGRTARSDNDNDIVIIAIDDRSIAALGRWPWRRVVHAELLRALAAAPPAALGMDVIFSEPDLAHPDDDVALAAALRANGHVVLPLFMQKLPGQAPQVMAPTPRLAGAARALGHIHLELDVDGVVRSVFLREGPDDAGVPPWDHFALALLRATDAPPALATLPGERRPEPVATSVAATSVTASSDPVWRRDFWMRIPYAGPPGHFRRVSYIDVLDGTVPAASLRGKIVLVGATATGIGDAYPTPMAGEHELMPGVEIMANVVDSLEHGVTLRRLAPWHNALLNLAPLLLCLLGLRWFKPRHALAWTIALSIATLLLPWLLQRQFGVQVYPVAALLCMVLAYPLWSAQRLEAAMRYLLEEFRRTRGEFDFLALRAAPGHRHGDGLERRIVDMANGAAQLRDLQRFVRGSLDRLPDATLVTDADGRVLLGNAAAARHFDRADAKALRGMTLAGLLRHAFAPGSALPALGVRDEAGEVELQDRLGRDILLKYVPRPPTSMPGGDAIDHDKSSGWIISLIDISTVHQAERQRDEALRFISHDMRAPQSAIITLLDLERQRGAAANPLFDRIERHARRTLALSDDFIQLARAESRAYHFAPVNLADLLLDAVDQFWAQGLAKDLQLHADLPESECVCMADRSLLTRALSNVVGNAVKYSPRHGNVWCGLARDGAHWIITVRDQGRGIATEDMPHLFEKYRRLRPADAMADPLVDGAIADGAGLGLAFVKAVIARHGGAIEARRPPAGTPGAEFRITLAVAGDDAFDDDAGRFERAA